MNKETYKNYLRSRLYETRRNFGDIDIWDTPGEQPIRKPKKPTKPTTNTNPNLPSEKPRYGDPIRYPKLIQPIRTEEPPNNRED